MTYSKEERAVIGKAQSIKRKARQKAKADRPKNPKASRGRVIDKAYLAWLRRQPCALSSSFCRGPIDAAHIRTHKPGEPPTGLQRKPDDRRATPLCRSHHTDQHSFNEMFWWRHFGLDPFEVAESCYSRFLAESSK